MGGVVRMITGSVPMIDELQGPWESTKAVYISGFCALDWMLIKQEVEM